MFNDSEVLKFIEDNKLDEKTVKMYAPEFNKFIENKDKYALSYEYGNITLSRKVIVSNRGLSYLEQPFFKNDISINSLNINENPSKSKVIEHYVNDTTKGFYLNGKNGVGKTSLVVALSNNHYEKTKEDTLFVLWPDFIEKTKRFSKNNVNYINKVKYAKRLIIDDLGQESITSWSRDDILIPIITYRLERKLFTVITSNYTLEELKNLYTDREINSKKVLALVNKIKALCPSLTVSGEDYRRKN